MLTRRTPIKSAGFKSRAPSSEQRDPDRLRSVPAVTPGAFRAPEPVASAPAAQVAKAAPVRSQDYRRAVASLPCAYCGIEGYSQAAHLPPEAKGMGLKRTPFKRKNNAENIQSKVVQSQAQQARVAIISIAKSAKKRAFNAVGCSESPKQSTCMRGLHA